MSKNIDPLDVMRQFDAAMNGFQYFVDLVDGKMINFDSIVTSLDRRYKNTNPVFFPVTQKEVLIEGERPESGKTFVGQSQEAYCLECIERHAMMGSTEMRHAIDRYRSANRMTSGVVEKVRLALSEVNGIVADVENTTNAAPKVKEGLNEILDGVRWISKEYGISGKGLTRGHGTIQDLEDMRKRIVALQMKAYVLVEDCPTCKILGDETVLSEAEETIGDGNVSGSM